MRLTARISSLVPHLLPLALGAAALAAECFGDAGRDALRWERAALAAGEWWRILSGNVAHLGPRHLALNLAGLALVWLVVRPAFGARAWWCIALASALGVGLGLWWVSPGVGWYVGLSGVLHGLLAAGALGLLLKVSAWEGGALGFVLAGKLAWEAWQGPLPFTAETAGGPVITDAHLYGAIAGFGVAAVWHVVERRVRAGMHV